MEKIEIKRVNAFEARNLCKFVIDKPENVQILYFLGRPELCKIYVGGEDCLNQKLSLCNINFYQVNY